MMSGDFPVSLGLGLDIQVFQKWDGCKTIKVRHALCVPMDSLAIVPVGF